MIYDMFLFSTPLGRSLTTILLLFLGPLGPGLRVRVPCVPQPQTLTGCLFDLLFPRPPPCGWSLAFIAIPRTSGRHPSHRLRPALPNTRC